MYIYSDKRAVIYIMALLLKLVKFYAIIKIIFQVSDAIFIIDKWR